MLSRFFSSVVSSAIFSLLLVSVVAGQTVRFDTNVGTFDMELNPTGNANLQPHVDNMLAYVNAGLYDLTVINRAVPGFVMQMGGFQAGTLNLPSAFGRALGGFNPVSTFDPVIVDADNNGIVDFDVSGLLNTAGTVSLALSSSANTGTSSFFVNLGTNTNLDAANLRFVPFATLPDMATLDLIMSLNQHAFADGGLAGANVPILSDDRLVFVERAFVLEEPLVVAAALAASAGEENSSEILAAASSSPSLGGVPEPSSFALAVISLFAASAMSRRKIC